VSGRPVRAIVAEVLDVPEEQLTADSAPGEVEGWDSLASLEILTQVEQELGVVLTLEELAEVVTLEQWETRVREKLAAAES
jgi:acyl carrier protein